MPQVQASRPFWFLQRFMEGCTGFGMYEGFPKLGVPFWGLYNKDYIFGSILGSSHVGGLPYGVLEMVSWLEERRFLSRPYRLRRFIDQG